MKKLFTSLLICTLTICALSQSPEKMSYQAVIRNSSDQLVTNQKIGMRISILQGSVTGTAVYVETQIVTTNANGLLIIEIGGDTVESGRFDTIDWANGPYFIKTETDPTGGTIYTITGTSLLLSVPYALHAKTAEILSGGITETQNLDDVLTQNNSAGDKNITNLANPVNAQDAVTKAYVDNILTTLSSFCMIVIAVDGNIYSTVRIGSQVWMAQNLRTTKYNDGTTIPLVTDYTIWSNLTTPGYCWYDNDSTTYAKTYGALYNWYTVETGKLCPTGWHVPTRGEFTTLANYLGGDSIAGGKLKETGTTHWASPNTGATNETGFTALPGGGRGYDGVFHSIGDYSTWWSSIGSESSYALALFWGLSYVDSALGWENTSKQNGLSVRCLRD